MTDVAALSTPGTGSGRMPNGRVLAVVATPEGCRLTVLSGRRSCAVELPCTPNPVVARRWLAAVRRVEHVGFRLDGERVTCVVTGRSNRLPFTRRVPVALGLGLGALGAQLWVRGTADVARDDLKDPQR